jgi:phage tail sheath gpL-like
MALYPRLIGLEAPKIPVHAFQAVAGEWARGKLTANQANAAVAAVSGAGLAGAEITDATALVATVTAIPITGTAVQVADGRARRAARVTEIDQCLLLADAGAPGYSTEAELRAKLGV